MTSISNTCASFAFCKKKIISEENAIYYVILRRRTVTLSLNLRNGLVVKDIKCSLKTIQTSMQNNQTFYLENLSDCLIPFHLINQFSYPDKQV